MKVELISYTPNALELLIYTKNTRLQGQQTMKSVIAMDERMKLSELAYMKDTIKSSWEFVDYIFEISGVTRAFTHQLVRTRNASYAQETQRAVDVGASEWLTPDEDKYGPDTIGIYDEAMISAFGSYTYLLDEGMERQDARGVIPTNVKTSIIAKFDLRELHKMGELRLCTRTQGEYQDVFRLMKAEVVSAHPWAEDMIQVFCANHGSCCFPRFTECPIQKYTFNREPDKFTAIKERIKTAWETERFAANPIAVDGRTDGGSNDN